MTTIVEAPPTQVYQVFIRATPERIWESLYDVDMAAEPVSRVTWEIEPDERGVCKLTAIHDQLDNSPKTRDSVHGAGWMFVLSGLKTLLETGEPLQR